MKLITLLEATSKPAKDLAAVMARELSELRCSAQEINKGDCGIYIENVVDAMLELGYPPENFEIRRHGANAEILEWFHSQGLPERFAIATMSNPWHEYLYFKPTGKFHDAETPQGVAKVVDLPFYQRWIKWVASDDAKNWYERMMSGEEEEEEDPRYDDEYEAELSKAFESAETDRATTAHARRVADAIQDYLGLHGKSPWGMNVVGREGGIPSMYMQGVEKILRTMDWDEDALESVKDLNLLFIPKGTYKHLAGGYGTWEGKPIIIMEFLLPDSPPKYVDTRFSGVKKVFMHEFTHHLDSLRTQGKAMGVAGRWKPEEIQHHLTDYFSNPKEFNAYFTEVIEELDATFNRVIPKIRDANPEAAAFLAKKVLGGSFPEFVENVRTQVFGDEYVLTPVYRKKFVRRLYKHYVDIIAAMKAQKQSDEDAVMKALTMSEAYPMQVYGHQRSRFEMGECDLYALALHLKFGFKMQGLWKWSSLHGDELIHYWAVAPDGRMFDHTGEITKESIRKRWGDGKVYDASPDDVERTAGECFGGIPKDTVNAIAKEFAAEHPDVLSEQFKPETTIPNVDDILDDPEYFRRAKKRQARRVQMSPKEYIERAIKGFQLHYEGKSFEEVKRMVLGGRSKSKAEEYARAMQAGDKFPALSLDYTHGFSQEGLHRAIAAMMIGLETVPVVIVEPVNEATDRYRIMGPRGMAGWFNAKTGQNVELDWKEMTHQEHAHKNPDEFGTQGLKADYHDRGNPWHDLFMASYRQNWVRWLTWIPKFSTTGEMNISSKNPEDIITFLKSKAGREALMWYDTDSIAIDTVIDGVPKTFQGDSARDIITQLRFGEPTDE